MRNVVMWLYIGWYSFAVVAAIVCIGRPRGPYTPGLALVTLVTCALLAWGIVWLAQ